MCKQIIKNLNSSGYFLQEQREGMKSPWKWWPWKQWQPTIFLLLQPNNVGHKHTTLRARCLTLQRHDEDENVVVGPR